MIGICPSLEGEEKIRGIGIRFFLTMMEHNCVCGGQLEMDIRMRIECVGGDYYLGNIIGNIIYGEFHGTRNRIRTFSICWYQSEQNLDLKIKI